MNRRRGALGGTESEHRRDAIKALALARELTKSAAKAYQQGECAKAVEQLDAAGIYLGAATASGAWTTDRPLRLRATAAGKAHEAVLRVILDRCIRPSLVR